MRLPLSLLLLLSACDCGGSDIGVRCGVEGEPEACGSRCTDTEPCPAGLFCNGGRCDAECGVDTDCAIGFSCADDGRCELDRGDAARADGSTTDGARPDGLCADVMLEARPTTPNVIVVVDQSSSMTERFGRSNRWDALRDSLLDRPDGFIFALQSQVRFGLALFSARADGNSAGPPVGMCPLLETVPPALDNYDAIRAVYAPAEVIDETPTGDSLDALLSEILRTPDRSEEPTIFILATDGEPDRCEELNPQRGQEEALAATQRAYDAGIRTYIISVGRDVSESHLQDMANTGLGRRGGDPDAPFYVAGDDEGLRDALREIIGGELSCVVELRGRIDPSMACSGEVRLNGSVLPCDDPNGWEAVDETHIELRGDACDELQSGAGATLTARFPCSAILI